MAIKVSGTTVIDDSRQLSNIASVDATTVAALGAAGVGGGGTAEFTASESLVAGDPVVINASSQLEKVIATVGSHAFTSSRNIRSSYGNYANGWSVAWNPDLEHYLVVYDYNSVAYGAILTQSSIGELTVRNTVQLDNQLYSFIDVAYNPDNQKFGFVFRKPGTAVEFGILTTDASYNVSFNNTVAVNTDSNIGSYDSHKIVYDTSLQRFIISYAYNTSVTRGAVVSNTSGISITLHNDRQIASSYYSRGDMATDNNGTIVMATRKGFGTETISATTFTATTSQCNSITNDAQLDANGGGPDAGSNSVAYDSNNGIWLISHFVNNSNRAGVRAATVSSGTITLGSVVEVESSGTNVGYGNAVLWDPLTGGQVFYNTYSPSTGLAHKSISVSGTTVTLGSANVTTFSSFNTNNVFRATGQGDGLYFTGLVYNNDLESYGSRNPVTSNLSNGFLGFAAESISSSGTGDVTVTGGVTTSLSGLSAGNQYYVTQTGALSTDSTAPNQYAGIATSSTDILVKG